MDKKPKMRWMEKDLKEMRRVLKNYNAKVRRQIKSADDYEFWNERKVGVNDFKDKIKTRQDFNRELNSLKRFSRRGREQIVKNEKGLKLTKHDISEAKEKVRIINIKRAYERKKIGFSPEKGNMYQLEHQNLTPKNLNLNKSSRDWEKYIKSIDKEVSSTFKEEQINQYKENYFKAIEKQLGNHSKELINLLKDVDTQFLYEKSMGNEFLNVKFIYDPQQQIDIFNVTMDEWKRTLE